MTLSDDINDFCFFDFETRGRRGLPASDTDVTTAGTYRYARSSYPVILTSAVGANTTDCFALDAGFHLRFDWAETANRRLRDFYRRALDGAAWFVAWNAAFDRETWNNAFPDAPLAVEMVIDAMAQAVASNLPPDLQGASTVLGRGGKQEDGKALIRLFAPSDGGTPQSHPAEWQRYKGYAIRDTDELRGVFQSTLPLSRQEWEEYWVSERINQRGMGIDLPFVERAAALASAEKTRTNKALAGLTDGVVTTVNQNQRIADWVYDRLEYSAAREVMVKEYDEEEGELVISKIGIGRSRVEALLAFFADRKEKHGLSDTEEIVVQVLELRQFGGSSTPLKFSKIAAQHDGGRLKGQYVFNGAAQTGRFCVARDTLVDTPQGRRYIVDLSIGDKVITHLNRPCPVTAVIFKGRETLYRLYGPAGEIVTATAQHRMLTCDGWRHLHELFERLPTEQEFMRASRVPLSFAGAEHGADRSRVRHHRTDCRRDLAAGVSASRAETPSRGLSLAFEDGRGQPDVRHEESGRAYPAARARSDMERERIHVRTPDHRRECAGSSVAADDMGSSSHRREQDEQLSGQPRHSDEVGTPETTQEEAWFVVCVGEGEVWDISVEGDESYLAGGIAHHNSSRGVQVHNLTRSSLGEDEGEAIETIKELEI